MLVPLRGESENDQVPSALLALLVQSSLLQRACRVYVPIYSCHVFEVVKTTLLKTRITPPWLVHSPIQPMAVKRFQPRLMCA